jgi:hypothetical protein
MAVPTPRAPLAPVRSVNENRVLRQGPQPFSVGNGVARPHSPTKLVADGHQAMPRALIVVPKPSASGAPTKTKVLPGFTPLNPIAPSAHTEAPGGAENAEPQAAPDPKARRHGFEPIAPLRPESPNVSDDQAEEQQLAPKLKHLRRSVRKRG